MAARRTCYAKLGKALSKLLQFTNHHVLVEVNRGFGFGLEIQVNYYARVITNEKSLKKIDNELHVKKKKCVKQKHPCVFYFPNQS